ncbi:tetratricopeptide repeat protein [Ferruginibacter albus]|uniref:tetratricopeptide repeat protein n=1 Tax=Ferruginibacter albus TaxID=2875540 RepID=UPI001CC66056|nr:tetratricopeptide repeat protein [Ferruginibacter albus]UAY50908.1 tetratricopeptide repeat protein [Ferruginibacter albus]
MSEQKTVINTGNEEVDAALGKAKDFWDRFSKIIIYVSCAIILVVGGWWVYKNYVVLPKQDSANDALFQAESLFDKMTQQGFNKDSINIVLNGGTGVTSGVVKIINNYGSTPAGNRAKLIAGACYLHLKEYDKAIKYLNDFSTTDADQVQATVYSLLGDAYSEQNKSDDALSFYKKAASVNEKDDFISGEALYKAGRYAESIGKKDDAIETYKKLRDNYPKSAHAAEMDKYLARLGVLN